MPDRNRNALRSQQLIRDAFCALVAERGAGRISVADICRAADINRSTFYAHYDNVDDLFDKLYRSAVECFGSWLADVLAQPGGVDAFFADPRPALEQLCEVACDAMQVMNALTARYYGPVQGFGMDVRAALLEATGPLEGTRLMRFDLVAAALTNVYFTWYAGYYGEMSAHELAENLAQYIQRCRDLA